MGIRSKKVIFRTYYFFFVMGTGVVMPFLNLYFKKIGLTGKQIGTLSSLGMVCMFAAPLLWGMINDRYNRHGRLLGFLIVAGGVSFFAVSFSNIFYYLIPVIILFYFFYSPLVPLSDAMVLEYVHHDESDSFGKIRLWGTIGFVLASIVVGRMINRDYVEIPPALKNEITVLSDKTSQLNLPPHIEEGIQLIHNSLVEEESLDPEKTVYRLPVQLSQNVQLLVDEAARGSIPGDIAGSIGEIHDAFNSTAAKDMKVIFYGFAIVMTCTLIVSSALPKAHAGSKNPDLKNIKRLFANRNLVLFFAISFIFGAASTASLLFLSIYLDTIGAKGGLIGYSWAFAASFEIVIFLYNKKILDRIGVKWLLIAGMSASALRWFLCSMTHNPLYALPIQMLHSLTFAALSVGAITFVFKESPPEFRAIGQFAYRAIANGLGAILGMISGGYMLDTFGIFKMYKITSLTILVAVLLMILFIREPVESSSSKVKPISTH